MTERDRREEYNSVVRPIMNYVNSLPNSKIINIHGSVFSERGTADLIGCINGKTVVFECKRDEKEDLRKIQKWRLSEWIKAGAVVGGVSSVDHVRIILQLMGII